MLNMIVKTLSGHSLDEIGAALSASMTDGFRPTLAILFLSAGQDREAICRLLDRQGIAIFGATSSTVFTDKSVESDATVALLLDMDPALFKIVVKDFGDNQVYEAAAALGREGLEAFTHPAYLISTANFRASGEAVVRGLTDVAGENVAIAGAGAGEPGDFTGWVFTNHQSTENGMIALILNQDRISLKGMAVSGWKAVGTEKTVTRSDGSRIYAIDDKPAFDVIQKFIGSDAYWDDPSLDIVKLNMTYPLQFERPGGSPKMLPAVVLNKADRSVLVGGTFSQGATFRFSLPPDFEVVDQVLESARQVKETELPEADALIVFSCVGRLVSLGPMSSLEVEGLADVWKKPMIGFFSLGEFGTVPGGKPEFHGTTVSWVALKEK